MKWGEAFSASHVNALYASARRHMRENFTFLCLTDDARGLCKGIEARGIPDVGLPDEAWDEGCWPKLAVFTEKLIPSGEVVLFLDLDLVIQDSLAPFIDIVRQRRGLVIQREWNPLLWNVIPLRFRPDRGVQSSVFGFLSGDFHDIPINLRLNAPRLVATFRNDQNYLTALVKNRSYWPQDFCVSFKRSCLKYSSLNKDARNIRRPKHAKIVVFHGNPRPWDTLVADGERWGTKTRYGIGPVPWIRDHYEQVCRDLAFIEHSETRYQVGSMTDQRSIEFKADEAASG